MRRRAPCPADFGEDRRKHLEFIQASIGRMSATSAAAKGWSLTVAVATIGYAWTKGTPSVALLGALALVLFASIDSRYLLEERKFRALYNAARAGAVELYDMDASRYAKRHHEDRAENCTWHRTIGSWTILGFYGWMILFSVGLGAWLQFKR